MQLIAEKEILIIVVASLVVHCCAVKKKVIVASQLYDVADVQFTVEKEGLLEVLQFSQKYNLGNYNLVPNIVIMLRIFLIIAVSGATCERSFSKLKLIKSYLRSSMSTLRLRNLATLSVIGVRDGGSGGGEAAAPPGLKNFRATAKLLKNPE